MYLYLEILQVSYVYLFWKSGTEDRERPGEGIGCIGSAEKEFRDPHLENTELV